MKHLCQRFVLMRSLRVLSMKFVCFVDLDLQEFFMQISANYWHVVFLAPCCRSRTIQGTYNLAHKLISMLWFQFWSLIFKIRSLCIITTSYMIPKIVILRQIFALMTSLWRQEPKYEIDTYVIDSSSCMRSLCVLSMKFVCFVDLDLQEFFMQISANYWHVVFLVPCCRSRTIQGNYLQLGT